jgi:predicted transcriptional regulator
MGRKAAKEFQDLIVWQKAHEFVISLYRYSELMVKIEEVSKLLEADISTIRNSIT